MTQIKKGAIVSYITVAFNIISGFFFTPFLIGKVGIGPYGVYTLVTTFLNYFLIDFGLGNAVAKYLSEYKNKNEIENANRFISVVFKFFALIAFLIGVLFFILYFFLDSFFSGLTIDEITIFKQMYAISGLTSVVLFIFIPIDGMLVSHELFFEQKIIELLRKILIILLSCIVLIQNTSVVNMVVINAIVGFFIVGLKFVVIKRRTKFRIFWNYFDITVIKKVGKFSVWLTVIMIAQRLIIPIAPTILGRFSNSIEISIFSIATIIEGYVYTLAACLNGLFLPKLTGLYLKNKRDEINHYFKKVGRTQTYVIGLIISTFIIFGKEFLILWVGEQFNKAYYVLLLILPSTIIVYAQEVANSMMLIQEKHKYKAFCYLLGAMLSVVITCLLSSKMGAIGAGIGISCCLWSCQVILMNFIYFKLMSFDIKGFFINCYGKTIPCLLVTTFIGFFINNNISKGSISFFALKCCLYIVCVCVAYYFIAFCDEDKLILKSFLKRKNKNE